MIIKKIHISWRKGKGASRYLIGLLTRESSIDKNFVFEYQKEEVLKAKKEGFISYPDFPNLDINYNRNLEAVFSLRLMPKTRSDRNDYLSFWNADNMNYDWFDELGFTQGKLATDNFEFLAEFPQKYNGRGVNFVSEIASLSHSSIDKDSININDKLRFEKDLLNLFDEQAVKVFKDNLFIGYVKRGHNLFFQKAKLDTIEMIVKSIEKNGKLNQIYFSTKVVL
jgi:hypothetical protein